MCSSGGRTGGECGSGGHSLSVRPGGAGLPATTDRGPGRAVGPHSLALTLGPTLALTLDPTLALTLGPTLVPTLVPTLAPTLGPPSRVGGGA